MACLWWLWSANPQRSKSLSPKQSTRCFATASSAARLKKAVRHFFYYNQFLVATCCQRALFGTITTHIEKYFYRWSDPYPRTLDDLEHGATALGKEPVSGESMLYLGGNYRIDIIEDDQDEIRFTNKFIMSKTTLSHAREQPYRTILECN